MQDLKDYATGSKKISKKRGQGVWVAVGIIAMVVIAFIIGMFGNSGETVDKTWLGDRISGTWGDFVGVPLFLGCAAWIVYLIAFAHKKEIVPVGYGSKKQEWRNVIIAAALGVVGILLIWLQ